MDTTVHQLFMQRFSPLGSRHLDELRQLRDAVSRLSMMEEPVYRMAGRPIHHQPGYPTVVILAKITAATQQTTSAIGSKMWYYRWTESVWNNAVPSPKAFVDAVGPMENTVANSAFLPAINVYEVTTADDGGNVGGALSRLSIPIGSVVEIHLPADGQPWFIAQNPLEC